MNWDDLRYFLALHRSRSYSAASRKLGVNHATVARRIASLGEAVGGTLFERTADGYELTTLGAALLPAAVEAEAGALRAERVALSADTELRGQVRITTAQLLSRHLLAPAIRDLRDVHPEIVVDAIEDTRFARLERQEADIALRMRMNSEFETTGDVRVRRLGAIPWRLYGTDDVLLSGARPPVIVYDDAAPAQIGAGWLDEHLPNADVVCKTSSMYTACALAELGVGAAFLPAPWAAEFGLRPLADDVVALAHVFIGIHPDLRQAPRMRAVFDQIVSSATQSKVFVESS